MWNIGGGPPRLSRTRPSSRVARYLGRTERGDDFGTVVVAPLTATSQLAAARARAGLDAREADVEAAIAAMSDEVARLQRDLDEAVGEAERVAVEAYRIADLTGAPEDGKSTDGEPEDKPTGVLARLAGNPLGQIGMRLAPVLGGVVDVANFKPVVGSLWSDLSDTTLVGLLIAVTFLALMLLWAAGHSMRHDGAHDGHALRPLWIACGSGWLLWGLVAFAIRLYAGGPTDGPAAEIADPGAAATGSSPITVHGLLAATALLVLYLMSGAVAMAAIVLRDRAVLAVLSARKGVRDAKTNHTQACRQLEELIRQRNRLTSSITRHDRLAELRLKAEIASALAEMTLFTPHSDAPVSPAVGDGRAMEGVPQW